MKRNSYWYNYGGSLVMLNDRSLTWWVKSINNDSKTIMNNFLLKRLDLALIQWNFEIQHIILFWVKRAVQLTALTQKYFETVDLEIGSPKGRTSYKQHSAYDCPSRSCPTQVGEINLLGQDHGFSVFNHSKLKRKELLLSMQIVIWYCHWQICWRKQNHKHFLYHRHVDHLMTLLWIYRFSAAEHRLSLNDRADTYS